MICIASWQKAAAQDLVAMLEARERRLKPLAVHTIETALVEEAGDCGLRVAPMFADPIGLLQIGHGEGLVDSLAAPP